MNRLCIKFSILLLCVLSIIATGCGKKPVEKGAFYTAGNWDIPPAFHGNPWAPGGENVTNAYIYEPLFLYNPSNGEFYDRLGNSYEESEDLKTLTVKLKEGVYWHDGNKFSSKDVQSTFYLGYLKNWPIWKNLEDVKCIDDNTVVFKWKKLSPTNKVRALTQWVTSSYVVFGNWSDQIPEIRKNKIMIPKDNIELLESQNKKIKQVREVLYRHRPKHPVGTGPFKIGKVSASDISLNKFEKYYGADNVKINKVRIMRWGGNEVVWSYLIAGEVDAVTPACPYDVAQEIFKRNPRTRLITPFDMSDYGLIFNCTKKPTSDINFRRAVAHIVDRDIIRKIAYYYGITTNDYSLGIPQSQRYKWFSKDFYTDLTKYDYNWKKAEEILRKAGYRKNEKGFWMTPEGNEIELEIVAMQGLNDLVLLAEASSAQLKKFGIKCEIRTRQREIYASMLQDNNFDIAADNGAQFTKYGDPSISLNRFFWKGAIIQKAAGLPEVLNYKGREVNTRELAEELYSVMDHERRKEIVEILAFLINENLPYLACYEKRLMIFTTDGKRVTGWPAESDPIWGAAPGAVENLYCTMIVKGILKPAP